MRIRRRGTIADRDHGRGNANRREHGNRDAETWKGEISKETDALTTK